ISQRYIYIVGSLSGFSVASATFLAGFIERTGSAALLTVIGMFLTAFLVFVGTAMIFATVPGTPARKDADATNPQRTIYFLGNCGYYIGFAIAWYALRPFLTGIRLNFLADIFTWLLLFAGIAGAARLGFFLYLLNGHRGRACLALPLMGFVAAALYRFV